MQNNYAGIDVEDLNTAGKLYKRLFPVGVASNDQGRSQTFDDLPNDRGTTMSSNGIVGTIVRDQDVRPVPQE